LHIGLKILSLLLYQNISMDAHDTSILQKSDPNHHRYQSSLLGFDQINFAQQ